MVNRFEQLLLQVSLSCSIDSGNLKEAQQLILSSLLDGILAARAGIWMVSKDKQTIECHMLVDSLNPATEQCLSLCRNDFPHYFRALDNERVIRADDALSHEATCEFSNVYLKPLGISSMLDVPIRHKGAMVGIICIEHVGLPRHWQDDEASFASALADLYGRALSAQESFHYQKQLETLNQQLETKVAARTREIQHNMQQLKEIQQQLIEAEKMAALGSLVAGIAHEVNNPLGIAITAATHAEGLVSALEQAYQQNLLGRSKLEKFFRDMAESQGAVNRNLERAAKLITSFKQTAVDQSSYDLLELELCSYLESLLSNLRPYCRSHQVDLAFQGDSPCCITTYPGAIAQIVSNLVMNACVHAFDQQTDKQVTVSLTKQANQWLQISVKDNGKGMTKEIQKRATDPFFTTRRGQGGSGLGLSIVYNLTCQTLQGEFKLTTSPGYGVEIDLLLPPVLATET